LINCSTLKNPLADFELNDKYDRANQNHRIYSSPHARDIELQKR
jgi:hypothetical protein